MGNEKEINLRLFRRSERCQQALHKCNKRITDLQVEFFQRGTGNALLQALEIGSLVKDFNSKFQTLETRETFKQTD